GYKSQPNNSETKRPPLRSREQPTLQQNTTRSLQESRFVPNCQSETLSILLAFRNIRALSEKPPELLEPTCFLPGASQVGQRPFGSLQLHSGRKMVSGDSFLRVSVMQPREGGQSQAARSNSAHAGLDESTFESVQGKLLGFVVSERNIEVDTDKDDECQKAFDTIKAYVVRPPVLVSPSPGRPLILYLIMRRQSLGCLLGHEDESTHTERAIYYLSKKFTKGEPNYPEIEKMCCMLMWAMQRLRQYTLYHTIRLLSKADPLKYLLDGPSSGQAIADYLAEFSIEDDTPINSDFPDERILHVDDEKDRLVWKMYFVVAVNSTGSGIGTVLISLDWRHYPIATKIDFPCTNNVAEYEACIFGLQAVINFKTKDAELVPYHEYLEDLIENFEKISFTYTPHIKNQFAKELASLASIGSITKENLIETLEIEIHFLLTAQYPAFANRHDRKTLRHLAAHYVLSGEMLYRRSFDATLLRCVDENETQRLMEEVHEGSCGPRMNGIMLAKKLMRLGYFGSTMEIDCVKACLALPPMPSLHQPIKAPTNELHPIVAPWPFSMWGINMIDPIPPKASNGHLFILVAIDYLSKWIKAIKLASVTAKAVARILKRDIIARYRVLATIITNNAKNLNKKVINKLCAQFKIQHRNSSPYRPQMNDS
ncbi:hypothetical protein CRG98_037759, partial [Punica granatum]